MDQLDNVVPGQELAEIIEGQSQTRIEDLENGGLPLFLG